MHQTGSYYSMNGVGPGIDISHYGAPYQGMLGLGMLYRYEALGMEPWTGKPSDDPRMVKRHTTIRATYRVRNLGGERTSAGAANAVLAKARALFRGNTVRKIGSTGWTGDGKVGFEVILGSDTRAGEIKRKNFQAGAQAASQMGGNVAFYDSATTIPLNAFVDAPPAAPAVPETTPSSTPAEEAAAQSGFLTRKVAGLPVWALGLIGIGVVGGAVVMVSRKKKPAPTPNRRRRRRRSSRRRR